MNAFRQKALLFLIALLSFTVPAFAATPRTISYQGYLKHTDGTPVSTQVNVTFRLYAQASGGSPIWVEQIVGVTPQNGTYSVILGNDIDSPLESSLFDGSTLYLGVQVAGESEMAPRQQITSAPYALRADIADSISSTASLSTGNQIVSSVATGTAPLQVDSATKVTNLNADMLDDKHADDFVLTSGATMTGKLQVQTSANDNAGQFSVDNPLNGYNALSVQTNGTGPAFQASSSGTNVAGVFRIDALSSSAPALYAATFGTGPTARFMGGSGPVAVDIIGNAAATGTITASAFSGSGSGLSQVNADTVDGMHAASFAATSHNHEGIDITTPVASATTAVQLAANPADCAAGAYAHSIDASGNLTCSTNGASLTGLNAGNISSGVLPLTQGGTGADSAATARISLGVPFLASANSFTGTQTIQTGTAAAKGMVVQGAAAQSANLQEWQNSGGTAVASVSPTGVITGNGSALTNVAASTVTNGVYTNVSYSDPAWISSLAGTKITGNLPASGLYGTCNNQVNFTYGLNSFAGDGSGLTNLKASAIWSGVLSINNGGTGLSTAPQNSGYFLRSVSTGNWGIGTIQASDVPNLSSSYVDLWGTQTASGLKTFTNDLSISTLFTSSGTGSYNSSKALKLTGNYWNGSASTPDSWSIYNAVSYDPGAGTYSSMLNLYHPSNLSGPLWVNMPYNVQTGPLQVVGSAHVTGTLTKGSGSFKIDHPLDPKNKYLYHSFVESSDMMNIYNGTITTDTTGFATVEMPAWFEALNREFRYQLTVIGQFAQAIIAREVDDGRFTIQTDKPAIKVSWQVTGIRKDAYAEKNRIQVEEDKPTAERGACLHPEACND